MLTGRSEERTEKRERNMTLMQLPFHCWMISRAFLVKCLRRRMTPGHSAPRKFVRIATPVADPSRACLYVTCTKLCVSSAAHSHSIKHCSRSNVPRTEPKERKSTIAGFDCTHKDPPASPQSVSQSMPVESSKRKPTACLRMA